MSIDYSEYLITHSQGSLIYTGTVVSERNLSGRFIYYGSTIDIPVK